MAFPQNKKIWSGVLIKRLWSNSSLSHLPQRRRIYIIKTMEAYFIPSASEWAGYRGIYLPRRFLLLMSLSFARQDYSGRIFLGKTFAKTI